MVRGIPALSAIVLAALALAACGGSKSSPPAVTHGYAAQPPGRILAEGLKAMAGARSYVLAGTQTHGRVRQRVRIALVLPSGLDAQITDRGVVIRAIIRPPGYYIRGNRSFYLAERVKDRAKLAADYANRWLKTPAADATRITSELPDLAPKQDAKCLAQTLPRPKVSGVSVVAGQPAVVLHSAGGTPGSAPSELYVATAAPHYPLRYVQLGDQAPGGSLACNQQGRRDVRSDLTFSDWNSARIAPPAGALDIR